MQMVLDLAVFKKKRNDVYKLWIIETVIFYAVISKNIQLKCDFKI